MPSSCNHGLYQPQQQNCDSQCDAECVHGKLLCGDTVHPALHKPTHLTETRQKDQHLQEKLPEGGPKNNQTIKLETGKHSSPVQHHPWPLRTQSFSTC